MVFIPKEKYIILILLKVPVSVIKPQNCAIILSARPAPQQSRFRSAQEEHTYGSCFITSPPARRQHRNQLA